ncbi:hypothetical protein DJ533_10465 [Acinetobacter defluvii]|uniref:Uncharacterized protein n=1 Tax=Acinetobacter defluvii TaxID=1871111 RepID=A0A2S2FDA4_9GAMM|nr:hypothetical protein [Acinetobacter defluvii]AWL28957.1 hypothetical protein DJ533_10465 [Acinetobacter defluvii]
MQLKPIRSGYDAYRRFKSGENVYTKIFGVDPVLCKQDKWGFDDFTCGHFTFYEGVEYEKISPKDFLEKTTKEDVEYFLGQEKNAIFGWLELKTTDGRLFELNINELNNLLKHSND